MHEVRDDEGGKDGNEEGEGPEEEKGDVAAKECLGHRDDEVIDDGDVDEVYAIAQSGRATKEGDGESTMDEAVAMKKKR